MSSFSTPQELENCFLRCERENMIGEESSNGNHVLQQSVQEIQSTLKEEQFYSSGYFLQLLYFDFTEFLQQDSFYFKIILDFTKIFFYNFILQNWKKK